MKKIVSLLALAAIGFVAVSCSDNDRDVVVQQDNDTYPVVYDITETFQKNADGLYVVNKTFNSALPTTDVILVYRLSGVDDGANVWQLIPRTLYLTEGELDYDYDFTRYDLQLKAGGNYDISTTPAYLTNQTFRVVFVPASLGAKVKVDYSNYEEVAKLYNLKEEKVTKL
ncbi:hypothetical protein ACFFUE_08925 [Bergeyella porcorum]|uniref:hypothetical protein n=1 Tax=Bergeyella porcorum TaxID=1735111 RepID=UPI0035E85E72